MTEGSVIDNEISTGDAVARALTNNLAGSVQHVGNVG